MITSLSNLIENTYIRYTRNQQDMYLLMESIVAATTVFKKSETIYMSSAVLLRIDKIRFYWSKLKGPRRGI